MRKSIPLKCMQSSIENLMPDCPTLKWKVYSEW